MNYLTHKAGGTLGMLVAFELMKKHGMLVQDINPYIQLLLMYPIASWGSTAPDLDIARSKSAEQTPIDRAASAFLRLIGAKHRSWQTHCLAITGVLTIALPILLETWGAKTFGAFDLCLLRLLIYGLATGIMSHLILDAMTPEGIHIIPNVKIRLVPRTPFFSTGGLWEHFIRILIYIAIVGVFLYLFFGISLYKL